MGKTALVLGGGAARGAFELGVWEALRELDFTIDIVVGTSIGAMNGAMMVMDSFEIAKELWETLGLKQVFGVKTKKKDSYSKKIMIAYAAFLKNFLTAGGYDIQLLFNTLEPCLDEDYIRASRIEYGLVTICLNDRKPLFLFKEDIPQGELLQHIFASCSVAPVFKPFKIKEKHYVDGGYYDNLPVAMALSKSAEKIIAVDLDAFGMVNKKLLQTTKGLTVIRSHWDLGNLFYFEAGQVQRNTRLGYLDAMRSLGRHDGQAYSFPPGTAKALSQELLLQEGKLPFLTGRDPYSFFHHHRQASKALYYYLRRRLINKINMEHMVLAWAETAGELFGLCPLKEYTLDTFNDEIQVRAKEIEPISLPEFHSVSRRARKKVKKKPWHRNLFPYGSRPALIVFLFQQMQQNPESIGKIPWVALAPILPAELLAALYLLWLDFGQ